MRTRSLLLSVLLIGAFALTVGPANAIVTFDVNGTNLTVDGDDQDDDIVLSCIGGTVRVNGTSTGLACATVTSISVNAGGGNDDIDALAVTTGSFPALSLISVAGNGGSDDYFSWPGNDAFVGGNGSDSFQASTGGDTFIGGGGDHTDGVSSFCSCSQELTDDLLSRTGNGSVALDGVEIATLEGDAAGQTLDAITFSGRANFYAGAGNDIIAGGPGMNLIFPEGGADQVLAGGGDDTIAPAETPNANDTINGGAGNDTLYDQTVTTANLVLTDNSLTGIGDDTISSIEEAEFTRQVGGTLNLSSFSGSAVLEGSSGVDTLAGGAGDDWISGQGASDVLDGNGGFDSNTTIATANMTVTNGLVNNQAMSIDTATDFEKQIVHGTAATFSYDVSAFTNGKVILYDHDGDDTIVGNGQTFAGLSSDAGAITLTNAGLTAPNRAVSLSGVNSAQIAVQQNADSIIDTSDFNGLVTVYSNDGDDEIVTGPKKDFVLGEAGNDDIRTGGGADTVYGQDGSDDINGGRGTDRCGGGRGPDDLVSCEKILTGDPPK